MISKSWSLPFRLLACLMVCLVLFFSFAEPLTAHAVEPVSISIVCVTAVAVVSAVLIALGLTPFLESSLEGFNALVNDIVSVLPAEFLVIDFLSQYFVKMVLSDGITYAPRKLVEWILSYLLNSGSVTYTSDFPYTIPSYQEICDFLSVSDSENYSIAQSYSRLYHFSFPDSATVTEGWIWTDSNVSLLRSTTSDGSSSYSLKFYGPYCISFNAGLTLGGLDVFDSSLTFPRTVAMTVSPVASGSLKREDKTEVYSTTLDGIAITDDFALSLDEVWTDESISVTDVNIGSDVAAIPLSVPATIPDTVVTSREDVIAGTLTDSATIPHDQITTNTDSTSAGLLATILAWLQKIWEAIKSLVSGITSPIVNAISKVVAAVDAIAVSISDALKPPDFDSLSLPSLKNFFPFCIPFDLYAMMQALCASPVAPSFVFACPLPGGGVYEVNIDLSAWNGVAQSVRYMIVGIYIVTLAVSTRKFIKW